MSEPRSEKGLPDELAKALTVALRAAEADAQRVREDVRVMVEMLMDDPPQMTPERPVPIRETTARLIYQTWQHKMVEIGQGHMVYDWHLMPGDVRRAWEDSVSAIVNSEYEGIVSGLADRLNTRAYAAQRALDVARFQARMRPPVTAQSGSRDGRPTDG